MSIGSAVLRILLWAAIVLGCALFFVQVVGRIIRHLVHFPAPAFVAGFIDNRWRRRLQPPAKIIDWIAIAPGMRVLEIGPGAGLFTIEAARRVTEAGGVFAFDIQPSLVAKLHARLRNEGVTNVRAVAASAYEIPYPDSSFDRVFMIAVLAEIPDRRRALIEIKRVLRSDGLLAIGELLPDPDYPLPRTVRRWCADAGFVPVDSHGGILHYLLTFRPEPESRSEP
jgi:ubiquinone/menaquinone biosynthesis C-methylase UbiE